MLNEDKIKLMTRMSAYEEHEGRKNVDIGNYFRSDYISMQVLKALISATIAFAIGLALCMLYDFEVFMQDIYKIDLLTLGKRILLIYGVFAICYAIISYLIYSYRYSRAKRSLKRYYNNLKLLSGLYEQDYKK